VTYPTAHTCLLLPVLVTVLAAFCVDAYLAHDPLGGRLEPSTARVDSVEDAGQPAPATAGQVAQEAEADGAAGREWITGSTSLPSLARANRVDTVDWAERGADTVVTIRGNGRFGDDAVTVHPLDGPPRLLVKLRGVEEEYSRYRIAVGTPAVAQIRVGHHPELTPSCLYVVLDLAQEGIEVSSVELRDELVMVVVRPR
jgi:hypothetical protein